MNQSTAYQRYRILANVRVEKGIGWWCQYSIIAIDQADAEQITDGFAEYIEVDGIEIDEFQLDGVAKVGECRSLNPLTGRANYNENEKTESGESEYSRLRWPFSWIVQYEMKRNHRKYNRTLANESR